MKGVWIELTSEWLGSPPGTKKHVWVHVAKELIGRGVAKEIDVEAGATQSDVNRRIIHHTQNELKEEIQEEVKAVETPSQDKMIRRPKVGKISGRTSR